MIRIPVYFSSGSLGRRDRERDHGPCAYCNEFSCLALTLAAGAGLLVHHAAHVLAAPVALEAIEIEAQRRDMRPQVGIVGVRGVGEQCVVQLPEAPLTPGGLGRAGSGERPGVG